MMATVWAFDKLLREDKDTNFLEAKEKREYVVEVDWE